MNNDKPFSEQMRTIRWRMAKEPFRFRDEVRVIPRAARIVVGALWLGAEVIAQAVHAYVNGGDKLEALAVFGAVTAIGAILSIFILLIVYVNRDAKRRGMSPVLWTLIAIFVPYAIGIVLYFVVREPMPYACPQCGEAVSARFNYCPNCKFNLQPTCPHCRREIRPDHRYCPHCASDLAPQDASVQPAPGNV